MRSNSPPRHPSAWYRRGATLVELLLSCGVISLLAALFLPAVQRSREASRKVHCVNNLRQLAAACQNHESAHRAFPYTATRMREPGGTRVLSSISPHAALLPYLDQLPVYETIEWEHYAADILAAAPASWQLGADGESMTDVPANVTALQSTVAVFLCPSDRQPVGGNNYRGCLGAGAGVYAPTARTLCPDAANATGAFVAGRRTRPAEFRDGLSQTALFSESITGDGDNSHYTPWSDLDVVSVSFCTTQQAREVCGTYAGSDALHDSQNGTTWLFGSGRHTWYNHVVTPNSTIADCTTGGNGGGHGVYAARSFHTGGVNVAFADGAVRFVADGVDLAVWSAAATRAGREVAGEL